MASDRDTALGGAQRHFPSTCWSRVLAGAGGSPAGREAMEELIRLYWKPVYAAIRAARAKTNEDAKDLAQDFFVWMMETDFVGRADPARGRFRAFVKMALRHFLSTDAEKQARLKRGGDRGLLRLDWMEDGQVAGGFPDPAGRTPDEILDEAWKHTLLARAEESLRKSLEGEGRAIVFEIFRDYYLSKPEDLDYGGVAKRHGITAGEVLNHLRSARKRYLAVLRALVAETVDGTEGLAEEWEALFRGKA